MSDTHEVENEYNEPKVRKCQQPDCEIVATHFVVWTAPMFVCPIHVREIIGLGNIMGFPTPERTARPMYPHEMILDDKE